MKPVLVRVPNFEPFGAFLPEINSSRAGRVIFQRNFAVHSADTFTRTGASQSYDFKLRSKNCEKKLEMQAVSTDSSTDSKDPE